MDIINKLFPKQSHHPVTVRWPDGKIGIMELEDGATIFDAILISHFMAVNDCSVAYAEFIASRVVLDWREELADVGFETLGLTSEEVYDRYVFVFHETPMDIPVLANSDVLRVHGVLPGIRV